MQSLLLKSIIYLFTILSEIKNYSQQEFSGRKRFKSVSDTKLLLGGRSKVLNVPRCNFENILTDQSKELETG